MAGEQLVEIIERLLETEIDLNLLFKLSKSELKTLIATVRNRVENFGKS